MSAAVQIVAELLDESRRPRRCCPYQVKLSNGSYYCPFHGLMESSASNVPEEIPVKYLMSSDLIRWFQRKGFVQTDDGSTGRERWLFTANDGTEIVAETAGDPLDKKRYWGVYRRKPGERWESLWQADEEVLGYLLPTLDYKWVTEPKMRRWMRGQTRAAERKEKARLRQAQATQAAIERERRKRQPG